MTFHNLSLALYELRRQRVSYHLRSGEFASPQGEVVLRREALQERGLPERYAAILLGMGKCPVVRERTNMGTGVMYRGTPLIRIRDMRFVPTPRVLKGIRTECWNLQARAW